MPSGGGGGGGGGGLKAMHMMVHNSWLISQLCPCMQCYAQILIIEIIMISTSVLFLYSIVYHTFFTKCVEYAAQTQLIWGGGGAKAFLAPPL